PSYSADSIVNSANHRAGYFAPNTFVTIYGTNLSFNTKTVGYEDLRAGTLPEEAGGVQVWVGAAWAHLLYTSPKQINLLLPYVLTPGEHVLRVHRDGRVGPEVRIRLREAAPAMFSIGEPASLIATHADGSLIDAGSPAAPGEVIVLYAVGLWRTEPDQVSGRLAPTAANLLRRRELRVVLGGAELAPERIWYAGITPGFAGLYQINVWLPEPLPRDPEIRLRLGDESSDAGLILPASDTSAGSSSPSTPPDRTVPLL
ncbi:MAG: hypothetical protein ACRD96_02800, partial [Bryobacteraceae bacterium]